MTAKPHGAQFCYNILKAKKLRDAFVKLRGEQTRFGWILPVFLIIFASLGAFGIGIVYDTQIRHPPVEIVGVCQVPASLVFSQQNVAIGCITTQTITTTTNGVAGITTKEVPAGKLYFPNGTRFR